MKYLGDAVILCGGKSERMNFDKAFLKIDGKYMIDIIYERLSLCFENVKLCANSKERFNATFDIEVVEDKIEGRFGPAVGIYSALSQATTKYVFVIACDMPLINPDHIEFMKRTLEDNDFLPDALVPMNGGYIEPLYSFYSTEISEKFEDEIKHGNYKIYSILDKVNTLYMDEKYSKMFDEGLSMFTNVNYPADLERFL